MPLDLSSSLDELVKALAVTRNKIAELQTQADGLAESIRVSVADPGTYPCANGLTLTLATNRRWNASRALEIVTQPANEPLARLVADYRLSVDRERLEQYAPDLAATCWDEHDWRVSVK